MNSIPPRAGGSTPEIVFSAEVHESCMGIEVDEATMQFVRDNPTLVVRLAKLWGVSQLDKTSLALVHAVEYRLWQELDAMDPETVERVAKEVAMWEQYGQPPLRSDFSYEDIQAVRFAKSTSAFAATIFPLIPDNQRRPTTIDLQKGSDNIDVSPKYL